MSRKCSSCHGQSSRQAQDHGKFQEQAGTQKQDHKKQGQAYALKKPDPETVQPNNVAKPRTPKEPTSSIGAKPNIYCEAIELVCGGSPKVCVLVEWKALDRVKSEL